VLPDARGSNPNISLRLHRRGVTGRGHSTVDRALRRAEETSAASHGRY